MLLTLKSWISLHNWTTLRVPSKLTSTDGLMVASKSKVAAECITIWTLLIKVCLSFALNPKPSSPTSPATAINLPNESEPPCSFNKLNIFNIKNMKNKRLFFSIVTLPNNNFIRYIYSKTGSLRNKKNPYINFRNSNVVQIILKRSFKNF